MKHNCFLRGVKIAILVALVIAGVGFAVMHLWNWLIPSLTGWRAISFVEAMGLLVLSRILFGGFHGRGCGGHWRQRMAERWEKMTPEEREKFQHGMRGRCCFGKTSSSDKTE
jgi:hypothetical protein